VRLPFPTSPYRAGLAVAGTDNKPRRGKRGAPSIDERTEHAPR